MATQKAKKHQDTAPLLVTVEVAANMLSIARSTLYELMGTGAIVSVKVTPTARRIEVKELHAFIQRSVTPY
jgi:excisionase family DNA binding protein